MTHRPNLLVVLGLVLAACGGGAATTTGPAQAPKPPAGDLATAEAVMEASLVAQGGRDKMAKLKSLKQTGTVALPQMGVKGTMVTISAPPRSSITTIELGGLGKLRQGVTNDIAWEIEPASGARILKDAELAVQLRDATFNADLVWKELYPKAELVGVVDYNGTQAYKVTLTAREGDVQTRYFAKDTLLPIGVQTVRETQMGKIPIESTISDYRDTNGIKYPYRVVQKLGPQTLDLTLTSVEHDIALPPDAFALPPEVAALKK